MDAASLLKHLTTTYGIVCLLLSHSLHTLHTDSPRALLATYICAVPSKHQISPSPSSQTVKVLALASSRVVTGPCLLVDPPSPLPLLSSFSLHYIVKGPLALTIT